jgi:dTDP-4-amino-4,6-dideoxygalactose transaminase
MLAGNRLFRHVPPTATPVLGRDLWRGLTASLGSAGASDDFRFDVIERTESRHCHLVSSGRAALAVILHGLRRLSDRTRVVVPAYGCPTVVQSVLAAGLQPVLCDVDPRTLDLDREALRPLLAEDPLAVVAVHLYGWAQDFRDLLGAAREHEFALIEDAAQAFGARVDGQMVGTWGDAGIYSLGRGKCLPAGEGGVIVTGERLAPAVKEAMDEWVVDAPSRGLGSLATLAGYGLATHPAGWWFVVRSSLNPADSRLDLQSLPPIDYRPLSDTLAGIGRSLLARLDDVEATRRQNARRLMIALADFEFVTLPAIAPGAEPVFLRLPLIVREPELANLLFDLLAPAGIGVSRSYGRSLAQVFPSLALAQERGFPGAAHLARCLLTLPTHPYLRERDFDRILAAFQAAERVSAHQGE